MRADDTSKTCRKTCSACLTWKDEGVVGLAGDHLASIAGCEWLEGSAAAKGNSVAAGLESLLSCTLCLVCWVGQGQHNRHIPCNVLLVAHALRGDHILGLVTSTARGANKLDKHVLAGSHMAMAEMSLAEISLCTRS